MRHLRAHRKLGRTMEHRRALLRNLVSSLFVSPSGRIHTTVEKAKEARPIAEKMITLGKREGVHARRLAARFLTGREVVQRLFDDIAPKFSARQGGYTRVLRLAPRQGDNADMAYLELVGIAEEAQKAKRAEESAAKKGDAGKKEKGEAKAAEEGKAAGKPPKPEKKAKPARETQKPDAKARAKPPTKGHTKGGKRGE